MKKESKGFEAIGDITLWQWLLILILAWCLVSCGPAYHLRRAEHHLKKAELKGAVIKPDTVYKFIEIEVPAVSYDTVFQSAEHDTVFISKDRLKIKYVNLPGDSVYIEGKCEADTVKIKVPVTVTKNITAPKGFWYWFPWLLFVVAIGAVAYLIRSIRS